MPAQTNGVVHAALRNGELSVDLYRKYYCRHCGMFLLEIEGPLGTEQIARLACPERRCEALNELHIGQRPPPKPDRGRWLAKQAARQSPRPSTSF